MLPDKNIKCPYTAFKTTCHTGVVKHCCPKWVRVTGVNPNTGQEVDTYDCSDRWLPALMIENSQQQRHTAAAVESLRNVVGLINGVGANALQSPDLKLIN